MAKLKGSLANKHDELLQDPAYRRAYERERLILNVTEDVLAAMESASVSKAELADRLGVSRANITQMLGGTRNMTLNTLSDICNAIGHRVAINIAPETSELSYAPYDASRFEQHQAFRQCEVVDLDRAREFRNRVSMEEPGIWESPAFESVIGA